MKYGTLIGGLKPRRNTFDLSYRKNFTCDMGQLIPVVCDECVPGDTWQIGNELTIRMQPLAAPVMHEITASVHYFFVPYRLLFENWTEFISYGEDSKDIPFELPRFPNPFSPPNIDDFQRGLLWDYFGFPTADHLNPSLVIDKVKMRKPLAFPWFAYNLVYNEYYRDEELQAKVDPYNNHVLHRNWRKDYFTSARTRRQAGIAPALPVDIASTFDPQTGSIANSNDDLIYNQAGMHPWTLHGERLKHHIPLHPFALKNVQLNQPTGDYYRWGIPPKTVDPDPANGGRVLTVPIERNNAYGVEMTYNQSPLGAGVGVGANSPSNIGPHSNGGLFLPNGQNNVQAQGLYGVSSKEASYGVAGYLRGYTFDVSDLRLAIQTQKWLERNSRAGNSPIYGSRYTTFLRAHFGVAPSDARLNRPEYIGGTRQPVIISEVLSTADTTAQAAGQHPVGDMSGHGLAADSSYVGRYHCQEYGLIIGIMSVMPKPAYQQGVNRQWLRELPLDFYFPELAHLSEQGIYEDEIWFDFGSSNQRERIFGFQGVYDEMRVKHDMVCSEMRSPHPLVNLPNLAYWNMANFYPSAPNLNSEFITAVPRDDIYAVRGVPGLIVNCQNNLKASRPLPVIAEPGLVDHF